MKKDGFQPISASNSEDALSIAIKQSSQINLILLDIMLPFKYGVELLGKLKARNKTKFIPIIIFTATHDRAVVIECLKLGVKDFIIKPPVFTQATRDVVLKKIYKALGIEKQTDSDIKLNTELQKIEFWDKAKTPLEKIEVIIKEINTILALPFAVIKTITLCSNSKTSAGDIAKPIKTDAAIASIVLKRANSVAYASQEKIKSIKNAVSRIGLKETRNIASLMSVFKIFTKTEKTSGFNKVEFWAHSMATGVAAQILGKILGYQESEDAFLAGLMHDIGKMIMDDFLQENFQVAIEKAFIDRTTLYYAVKKEIGMEYTLVGSRVTEKWGLPPNISKAIKNSHSYNLITNSDLKKELDVFLSGLICVGNMLEKVLRIGFGGDVIVDEEAFEVWDKIVTSKINWTETIKSIYEEVTEYVNFVKLPLEHIALDFPSETYGKVGIFLPKTEIHKDLIEIALLKNGFSAIVFDYYEDLIGTKEELSFIVSDFSDSEVEEIKKFKENFKIETILISSDKSIKNALYLPLDFGEFQKKIENVVQR